MSTRCVNAVTDGDGQFSHRCLNDAEVEVTLFVPDEENEKISLCIHCKKWAFDNKNIDLNEGEYVLSVKELEK